jgi:hypothetical protein
MILNKEELTNYITERIEYLNGLHDSETEIGKDILLGRILELNTLLAEITKYI